MNATLQTTHPPLRMAPTAFQWSVFPLVMATVIAGSYFLMVRGVNPALAILGPQFAAFFVVAVAERIYPYHQSWLRSQHDIRVDATHTAGIGITTAILAPFVVSAGVATAAWLSAALGSGLWPQDWPLLAQIALALVIGELPGYWVHRWQHSWDGLWRFHSVHHSAPRLYWLNAGRFHPIDIMLTYVPSYFLLVMLGCNELVLAYFGLVSSVHGIFQHANLQLRLGPLNWIFSMAELHRWHHSRTIEEANTNFGQTISIWDWVFGTRFLPKDREPPRDIGIADLPDFPMTWWAQILAPFRWARVKRESARHEPGAATAD
ncbi:fatty acid hydroxylase family protein [Halieaceae bacterium IMCC14734]|uniref:Fatty acid hydroxylase family protein n=1 Tax=Candidatus Litorirhabdus singularis TaxID=2518993 RepID=A0ABT3TFN6_9GAMM|nr:sterol desaturase family protein [Candidatus Litorirhabdus singularis]MCX2980581.1 fatty acid hydroxylase family protein [Candidatus Litorirhabdus singularis]